MRHFSNTFKFSCTLTIILIAQNNNIVVILFDVFTTMTDRSVLDIRLLLDKTKLGLLRRATGGWNIEIIIDLLLLHMKTNIPNICLVNVFLMTNLILSLKFIDILFQFPL